MTDSLIIGLAIVMGFSFLFDAAAVWAVESSSLQKYRLRNPKVVPLSATNKYLRISLNGFFALGYYFAFAYFFKGYVTNVGALGPLQLVGEVLAILLLYDLLYYWMHRGFHRPPLMRLVHRTHHKVRNPTAADGLYLDPWDNAAGLSVFFLSVLIVGPISTTTFLTAVFVYITINNINHTGIGLPHPIFKLTNHWARKHDLHHGVNPGSNYGTIFPIWDKMFGTYE